MKTMSLYKKELEELIIEGTDVKNSIIETAKANNLIVEKYLIYLFDRLANCEMINEEFLDEIIPWSDILSDKLKTKKNK